MLAFVELVVFNTKKTQIDLFRLWHILYQLNFGSLVIDLFHTVQLYTMWITPKGCSPLLMHKLQNFLAQIVFPFSTVMEEVL